MEEAACTDLGPVRTASDLVTSKGEKHRAVLPNRVANLDVK
jgi:hypothetical protein